MNFQICHWEQTDLNMLKGQPTNQLKKTSWLNNSRINLINRRKNQKHSIILFSVDQVLRKIVFQLQEDSLQVDTAKRRVQHIIRLFWTNKKVNMRARTQDTPFNLKTQTVIQNTAPRIPFLVYHNLMVLGLQYRKSAKTILLTRLTVWSYKWH